LKTFKDTEYANTKTSKYSAVELTKSKRKLVLLYF